MFAKTVAFPLTLALFVAIVFSPVRAEEVDVIGAFKD